MQLNFEIAKFYVFILLTTLFFSFFSYSFPWAPPSVSALCPAELTLDPKFVSACIPYAQQDWISQYFIFQAFHDAEIFQLMLKPLQKAKYLINSFLSPSDFFHCEDAHKGLVN